jgi:GDP-L-fucose synthase
VTGGAGLVGNAVRSLRPDAIFVTRRDADLTDMGAVRQLFDRVRPNAVLHLAALVGGVRFNRDHNADMLTTNVQIDANVLTAARDAGVDRLVAVLSSCAFDIPADRPATEADLHVGLPYEGNLGYGLAKRLLDMQCRLITEQDRRRFSTIAPVTMYGPHDNFDLDDAHVVAALIHRCHRAKIDRVPLVVWGTGRGVRQFVFARDVARILVAELDRFDGAGTTIVAPDAGLTIEDLARRIARVMAFDGPIQFSGELEGQVLKIVDGSKLAERLGDFTFTPLDEGLAITARWFVEHQTRDAGAPRAAAEVSRGSVR